MKTLPIFLAFLVMGVADAMGPLSDAVKTQYQLSNVMATLLPFFTLIAFAIFSVPGGVLAARIGKKKLLLLGLGSNAAAMLVPSLRRLQARRGRQRRRRGAPRAFPRCAPRPCALRGRQYPAPRDVGRRSPAPARRRLRLSRPRGRISPACRSSRVR